MLVIFYGVSCVGKTSIIKNLQTNFGWKIITTFTTRKIRENENEKKHISIQRMKSLEKKNFFLCVNYIGGQYYGTPKEEIMSAVESKNEIWCLDFPISRQELLSEYFHIKYVVMPENLNQLKNQIFQSGRTERYDEIIRDFTENYSNIPSDFYLIVNLPSKLWETTEKINKEIQTKLVEL